jgi:hypothetical protein
MDDTNYQVLLRIVEAEAAGEGVEGKKTGGECNFK